ncbi:MAG: helix-turn-helix domain-containing protein [Bilifractor sp.]|jgi:AraC-like DNA-binding protein
MEYHQPIGLLCHPNTETIRLYQHSIIINYVDQLNEMSVEFPHLHEKYYEIYYVEDGQLLFNLENKKITLNNRDIVLLNKGTVHGTVYTPEVSKKYFVMIFNIKGNEDNPTGSLGVSEENAWVQKFRKFIDSKAYAITNDRYNALSIVDHIYDESLNKGSGWEAVVRNCYQSFIILCLRNFLSESEKDAKKNWDNLPIAITKYLHANYYKPISIQEVADYFYVTPRHLTRIFKDYFGTSMKKTLVRYRISYAKNYLIDTDFSIEKIAEMVGISSASALSREFKQLEGINISEYRNKVRSAMKEGKKEVKSDAQ